MSGFTDLSTNFENNRNCLRRIARHTEQEFSKDSIVNVMEKFVKTVNIMDDTILVPCRLMDRQVGDSTDKIPAPSSKTSFHHHNHHHHHHHHHHGGSGGGTSRRKDRNATVHDFLSSADLFNLYTMLNALKNDLLWTRNDDDECNNDASNNDMSNNTNSRQILLSASSSISENDCVVGSVNSSETNANVSSDSHSQSSTQLQSTTTQQQATQPQQQSSQQAQSQNQTSQKTHVRTGSNATSELSTQSSSTTSNSTSIKGHIRRPSTASMASSNSTSNLSDSESEISNENDSGIEYEGHCGRPNSRTGASSNSSTSSSTNNSCTNIDKATELARQCRTHLTGLYRCLEQMTEAANYLTARYQSDIGPV